MRLNIFDPITVDALNNSRLAFHDLGPTAALRYVVSVMHIGRTVYTPLAYAFCATREEADAAAEVIMDTLYARCGS